MSTFRFVLSLHFSVKIIDKTLINLLLKNQTLSVEFIHDEEGKDQIREYMMNQGYEVVKEVTDPNWLANDFIFNKV